MQEIKSRIIRIPMSLMCVGFLALSLGGCVFSKNSSSGPSITIPTVEQKLGIIWNRFLIAMSTGNDRSVHSECTEAGYRALLAYLNDREPHADQWRRWSQAWSKWGPVRWESITPIIAYGKLGPAQKPASINFALTPQGWKLDYVSPAE
jgi:hypothetical protein